MKKKVMILAGKKKLIYLLLNSKLFKTLYFLLKNSYKTKIVFLGFFFKKKKIFKN
jgi:hypothetical protein